MHAQRLLILLTVLSVAPAQALAPSDAPAYRIIATLYSVAGEYAEQADARDEEAFADHAARLDVALEDAALLEPRLPGLVERLRTVRGVAARGEDALGMAERTRALRQLLVSGLGLKDHPARLPNLEHGREVFLQACAACHGTDGMGQTQLGRSLDPAPPDFIDPEDDFSPFQVFGAVTFGMSGTAMPSYHEALSDDDRWALAFYVVSLREGHPCEGPAPALSLQKLSTASDSELAHELGSDGRVCARIRPTLLPERTPASSPKVLGAEAGLAGGLLGVLFLSWIVWERSRRGRDPKAR